MKKKILLLIICFFIILTALVIAWKFIVLSPLENVIKGELEKYINGNISMGSFAFNTSSITFNDISVKDKKSDEIIKIKSIQIYYSADKYIKTRNPLTCISYAIIEEPLINLNISEDKKTNIQNLFKTNKIIEKKEIPFNGYIEIKNGKINLLSEVEKLPNNISFVELNGKIDLWANPQINYSIKAKEKNSYINIYGNGNYMSNKISATGELKDVNLTRWGKLIPIKDTDINSGIISGVIDFSLMEGKDRGIILNWNGNGEIKEGSINYKNDRVKVNNIKGTFSFRKDRVEITNLTGNIGKSILSFYGNIYNFPLPYLSLYLKSDNFKIEDIPEKLVPELKKYTPHGNFSFNTIIKGSPEDTFFLFEIISDKIELMKENIKNISINGSFFEKNIHFQDLKFCWRDGIINLKGFIKDVEDNPQMSIKGGLKNLNPAFLSIFEPELRKYVFSGKLNLAGNIIGSPKNPIFTATIDSSTVMSKGVYLENINSLLHYYNNNLTITELNALSSRGSKVTLTGNILNVKKPVYYLMINGEHINLEDLKGFFPSFKDFSGYSNTKVEIAGEQKDALVNGIFFNSDITSKGQNIKNVSGKFTCGKDVVSLQDLYGLWNSNPIVGKGVIYTKPLETIDFYLYSPQIEVSNLTAIYPPVKKLAPKGTLKLNALIRGYTKDPLITARLQGASLNFKDKSLKGFESLIYYQGEELLISRVVAEITGTDEEKNKILFSGNGLFKRNNDLWDGKFTILSDNPVWNGISMEKIKTFGYLSGGKIFINHFDIDKPGGKGNIKATGYISEKEINLYYLCKDLKLGSLKEAVGLKTTLKGDLGAVGFVKGNIRDPKFGGIVTIDDGKIGDINFSINTDFNINKKTLYLDCFSIAKDNSIYNISGEVELKKPWKISLTTDIGGGKISDLKNMYPDFSDLKIDGVIAGNITLDGKLEDIKDMDSVLKTFTTSGNLNIYKGNIKNINIDKINTEFTLNNGIMKLSNLNIRQNDSTLQARGTYNGKTKEISLNFLSPQLYLKDIEKAFNNTSLKGNGQIRGAINGKIDNLTGWTEFQLLSPEINNYMSDWVTGKFILEDNNLKIENFYMKESSDVYTAAGYIKLSSPLEIFITANARDVEIKHLLQMAGIKDITPIEGKLSMQIYSRGQPGALVHSAKFETRDMNINSYPVEKADGEVYITNEEINIGNLTMKSGDMLIKGKGHLNINEDTDFTIEGNNIQADFLEKAFMLNDRINMEGLIDFDLKARGPTEKLKLIGSFQMRDGTFNDYKISRIRSLFSYDGSVLKIDDLRFVEKDLKIIAKGTVPIQLKDKQWIASDPMDISINTTAEDLNIINIFNPDFSGSYGKMESSFHIGGLLFDPELEGHINIKDGFLQHTISSEGIRNLNLSINIDNNNIKLEHLYGKISDEINGKTDDYNLEASGNIHLNKFQPDEADIHFNANNVILDLPGYFKTNATIKGEITRNIWSPLIKGDILLNNYTAEVYPEILSDKMVSNKPDKIDAIFPALKPSFSYQSNNDDETITKKKKRKNIKFDLNLKVGDNFWIKSKLFYAKIAGDLKINGSLRKPKISGIIDIPQGTISLVGTKFNIKNSSINFSRKDIIPLVALKAQTFMEGREISVNITGPADNLNTEITSNPPMASNDIIGLLVPNQTPSSNSNYNILEQTAIGIAQGTVSEYLLNPIEEKLTTGLGLDIFSLKLSPSGTIGLEIGKKVNDWMRVSYRIYNKDEINQLNVTNYLLEREALNLEFKMNRYSTFNLGTNTSGGITTKLQMDYKF